MMQWTNGRFLAAFLGIVAADVNSCGSRFCMAADVDTAVMARQYDDSVRPLIARLCGDCHSKDLAEAEIDLTAFASVADVRKQIAVWQKVSEMLDSSQMPPKDAPQPTDEERTRLRTWVRSFLKDEAKRHAGDPGPVVLRRLSNAEYTYVLRDLTGVESLAPAREFPVDGAAGEGFTNAGSGLVMSPSLLAKYVDAAKDVAAHAVLLPDGIRFSPSTTRRDWTEELLAEIRGLYAIHSGNAGGTRVNLQGIVFDTNGGGRLPVERYFESLLAEREALSAETISTDEVARKHNLSPKYLGGLWRLMTEKPSGESLLVDSLRTRWKSAKPGDAAALAGFAAAWQQSLWKFSSVGHIGKVGGPKAWMEPVNPVVSRQEIRFKLPDSADGKDVVLYLVAGDAGDGNASDFAVWERPRLVAPGRPDLLLRDVRRVTADLAGRRQKIFEGTARSLAAAAEAGAEQKAVDVATLAKKHDVDAAALAAWFDYLGIATSGPTKNGTPIARKLESAAGYDFIKGWVGDDALSVVANSSDQHVRIPGNMQPHSVAVHPSPTIQVVVGWKCHEAATLRIEGVVQHAHPECGNGVVWSLELRRGATRQQLAKGTSQGPNKVKVGPVEKIAVRPGDFVSLTIGPRDGNHSCDLTLIDVTLADGQREWNLAKDVSSDILAGNPHKDSHGRAEVWHFDSEPATGAAGPVIPAGSLLSRWQTSQDATEKQKLATELQRLLVGGAEAAAKLPKDSPDLALLKQLNSLGGPLLAAALKGVAGVETQRGPQPGTADTTNSKAGGSQSLDPSHPSAASHPYGLDSTIFGRHPNGSAVEAASLCVQAPSVLEVRLPGDLVAGAEFVTAGALHPDAARDGSVQLQILTEKPSSATGLQPTAVTESNAGGAWTSNNRRLSHAAPVVVAEGSAARKRIESSFDEFRQWFPAALCYTKIVPVDEVVTLTLYHREDDALRRLMLSDAESARLNRQWDELHFVSHDALTLVDAYEQLWQYATQDADPKVFEPMEKPIRARAAAFRKQLVDAEPKQLDAVLRFAALAYRRPLEESERVGLRGLYRSLRDQELPHDEALRLVITRVLVSPEFLYRAERASGAAPQAVNPDAPIPSTPIRDDELAVRLSFFLWSSVPDAELRAAASAGALHRDDVLIAQTRRMMKDARVRRLATEFACQWLHVYEFDTHDEKSEAAFPTFSALRGAMYEEPIRFFTDLIQRDGSILDTLEADHTFVNGDLAKHYGLAGIEGPEWKRVDGVRKQGRGGILGMASTLAKQSGASRTSPILRGNWVSEVLLGEKLPKPPKGVPQLPDVVPVGLTERQLIEKHSSVESCAKCHAKIDPLGFALEGFDAIGRLRKQSPELPKVDTRTKLIDGTEIDGLNGLRTHLSTARRDDFVRQFCKKLLGYALGRGVQLSDEPLLDEMQSKLREKDYRTGVLLKTIVLSRQFRSMRVNARQSAD